MRWRKRRDEDFAAEIESHIALEIDRLKSEGMSDEEARSAARRTFGNVTRVREKFHDSARWTWLEQLLQDLLYACRTLAASPGFTLVAVMSLALGIGANVAVFSVVDAVVLKHLPVRAANELRIFEWVRTGDVPVNNHSGYGMPDRKTGKDISGSFSYRAYRLFSSRLRQFSDVVAYAPGEFTLTFSGSSQYALGQYISGNYFSGLGVQTITGRPILPDDDRPAVPRVAVLTYHGWEKFFGFDPQVIGRKVAVNQVPVTIVGVAPPSFQGLYPGQAIDVFVPISMVPDTNVRWYSLADADNWWVQVFGRIRPGVRDEAAAAAITAVLSSSIDEFAGSKGTRPPVILADGSKGVSMFREFYERSVWILTAFVVIVLLIACTNVANLLLARGARRQREMAIRVSIGAGRGRLLRQVFAESLLLGAAGAVISLIIAAPLSKVMMQFIGGPTALGLDVRIDTRATFFTIAVALLTSISFGAYPAWRASRTDAAPALKATGAATADRRRIVVTRVLITTQVAFSMVLLVGAGLFLRTLVNLNSVDLGFRPERVLTFKTDAGRGGYKPAQIIEAYSRIQERLEGLAGVESAGMSQHMLIGGAESNEMVYVSDHSGASRRSSSLEMFCSDSFLPTMQIPVLAGRNLTAADGPNSQKVAVVNAAFAKKFFPGENPVGKTFRFGRRAGPAGGEIRIVGIAANAHYSGVRRGVEPTAYMSYRQFPDRIGQMVFAIRTTLPPESLARAIRNAVSAIDANLPVAELRMQEEQIRRSLGPERLFAGLATSFGLLAALLAALGLYGVMAYNVVRRTAEIGIRTALGAPRSTVVWLIIRDSLLMVLAGVAIAIPMSFWLTGLLQKSLFGVKPNDPVSVAAAISAMLLVAAVAAWLPARRAARVDPVVALRYE